LSEFSAEHLLRSDPVEDKEGFFIALFVKKNIEEHSHSVRKINEEKLEKFISRKMNSITKKKIIDPFNKMSRMWLYLQHGSLRSTIKKR
jgi:putative methyltransferase